MTNSLRDGIGEDEEDDISMLDCSNDSQVTSTVLEEEEELENQREICFGTVIMILH